MSGSFFYARAIIIVSIGAIFFLWTRELVPDSEGRQNANGNANIKRVDFQGVRAKHSTVHSR
jgi:hypothetical protein